MMRDAIDNRNIEIICQAWSDAPADVRGENPRHWPDGRMAVMLWAMRHARDEAVRGKYRVVIEAA